MASPLVSHTFCMEGTSRVVLYPVCPLCPHHEGAEWEDLAVPPSLVQEGLGPAPASLGGSVSFTRAAPVPPIFHPAQPGIGLSST